ncbi:hypothetical protein AXG93_3756s1160 [Marchantia polymorpha subsp. ruderalis]|uniref:Uncharacterized protein n=1 Tax=Marchantia polymorpha subsp. ruderalis TaxID=1480154 RepID=A0A176VFH8_MARPO|nr:hypothetical protein AXG93_3756s1160 [Marchantia polymorpha subsp. ruderalis]
MMKDMRKDMKVSVTMVSVEKPSRVDTWPAGLLGYVCKRRALHSWQAVPMTACCRAVAGDSENAPEVGPARMGNRMSADEKASADVEEMAATVAPRTRPSHSHGVPRKLLHRDAQADHQFLAIVLRAYDRATPSTPTPSQEIGSNFSKLLASVQMSDMVTKNHLNSIAVVFVVP